MTPDAASSRSQPVAAPPGNSALRNFAVPPPRQLDVKALEPGVLTIAGVALLAVAAIFGWKESELPVEALALLLAPVAVAASWVLAQKKVPFVGPIAVGVAGLGSAAWYAMGKEPLLIIASWVAFVGSIALTWQLYRRREALQQAHRTVAWLTSAALGLASTFALYFLVFDATDVGLSDFIAKRAVLTLSWLVAGAVLVVLGRRSRAFEMRDAGFVVLAASMAKLVLYDMGQDQGGLRIATFAIGGVVLLVASRFVAMLSKGKA